MSLFLFGCGKVQNLDVVTVGDTDEIQSASAIVLQDDGSYLSLGSYKKGKEHGRMHFFDEDGSYVSGVFFVNGLKQGKALVYDENGLLTSYHYYRNDSLRYRAVYDGLRFVRYTGFPMVYLEPVKSISVNDASEIEFALELVKPPGVDLHLGYVEFAFGKRTLEKELEFNEGINSFRIKIENKDVDSCRLFYKHVLPLENAMVKELEMSYVFDVVRGEL